SAPARAPVIARLSSAAVVPAALGCAPGRLFDRRPRRQARIKIRHWPVLRRRLQPRLLARRRLWESRTLLRILLRLVLRGLVLRQRLRRALARPPRARALQYLL